MNRSGSERCARDAAMMLMATPLVVYGPLPSRHARRAGSSLAPGVGGRERALREQPERLGHPADDADLVAVLEVHAHPGQVDQHGNPETVQLVLRADAGELQQLWGVERAPRDDHFALGEHLPDRYVVGRGVGARIGPILVWPIQVLHADGPVPVGQHAGRQGVGLDHQSLWVGCGHLAEVLARAIAAAIAGGQRGEPEPERPRILHAPVVRIEEGVQSLPEPQRTADDLSQGLLGGGQDHPHQLVVVDRHRRLGQLGRKPAAVAVPAAVDRFHQEARDNRADPSDDPAQDRNPGEPGGAGEVAAALQALEVPAHPVASPGRVARHLGDGVPIVVVRVHGDHRVVGRAAAQRSARG